MINAEDVQVWLADPITKKFFEAIEDRIEQVKDILVSQAGQDSIQDSFYRGYSVACNDILNTKFGDED